VLATLACTAVICGLSLAIGHLVCRLAGVGGWSWLAPGAGMAALLCIASVAVKLPGHGWTALGVSVAVALAGLAAGRSIPPAKAGSSSQGEGSDAGAWEAVVTAAIVLAALSIPFVANGRFGVLGAGINNDPGFHIAWVESLANGHGAQALIDQLDPGYPIGPHSVAAIVARPFGAIPALTGFLMAVPVLTALTALAVLRNLRPGWRVAGAAATALPYMAVSYYAEGSFKEPALALMVLTFAVSLARLQPPTSWRAGLVPGLAAVGGVLTFARTGIAWPLAIVTVWLAGELVARRRGWLGWLREIAPALIGLGGVLLVGVLAELGKLRAATWTSSVLEGGTGSGGGGGNFIGQISPWRIFGGWPSPAFQLPAENDLRVAVATAIALVAVAFAAAWWVRRRQLALPAAVLACLIAYVYARETVQPYFSAKGMVVAGPLITLLAVGALFDGLPGPERLRELARSSWTVIGRAVLGLAFIAVLAWSSLLALRYGGVSEQAHADELRSLRPLLDASRTVLLDQDDYAGWELLGARLGNLVPYGYGTGPPLKPRPGKPPAPADFDSLSGSDLDRFRYAITVRGPYTSAPPENWRLVRRTDSFDVWERSGPTAPRDILPEGAAPGAILDCSSPGRRALSRSNGVAAVRPAPVVGSADRWTFYGARVPYDEQAQRAGIPVGVAAIQKLPLPPGRWDLSLQYQSPVRVDVHAAGLRTELPAVTEPLSQFWPVGRLTSAGRPVTVAVRASDVPAGALRRIVLLGQIVATRADWPLARVPLRRACGRYVDWYRLGP
jgi:hypothetical protein